MTLEDVLITFSRPDVLPIVGLAALSVLLWNVPVLWLLLYPFWLFNTYIHELSHVIVIRVTGGHFGRIEIYPKLGGLTPIPPNERISFLTLIAGYLGEVLFGGILILLSTSSIPSRSVLIGLGILQGLMCLWLVGNCYGFVAGLVIAALLFLAGWQLDDKGAASILLFLAVQIILSSFYGLIVLIRGIRKGQGAQSDAGLLQGMTAIPAMFWALLWCAIAVFILVWSVTTAYRDMPLY